MSLAAPAPGPAESRRAMTAVSRASYPSLRGKRVVVTVNLRHLFSTRRRSRQRILAQPCLKARVEPEDVASLVLFLASDDARMCTAHEYFVEAGCR